MNNVIRPYTLHAIGAAVAMMFAINAYAQQPQLPPPDNTDPVALAIMKGFPPPPEKVVSLGNLLKYPNSRWGFHHIRELGPTANVWHGKAAAAPLPLAPRQLG